MVKIDKWKTLKAEVERAQNEYTAIPNPTAEQCGKAQAYIALNARMCSLEALEKKLDKS